MPSSSEPTTSTSSESATSSPSNAAGVLIVAAVVGIALGVFSTLADGIIPGRLITLLGNIAAPWVIAAFEVGYRANSVRQGAIAGAVALVVGVVVYYAIGAVRGYPVGSLNVLWTVVAMVAGPIVGACAAAISTQRDRPPLVAVILPAAMLVAEGLCLVYDRKFWRSNFAAEPYRFIDVGVTLALITGGFVAAWVFARRQRPAAVLGVAATGVFGAFCFVLLERIIVSVV